MAHHHSAEGRRHAPQFIGSLPDGPDHMVIEIHGDLDADFLDRLAAHIKDAIMSGQRFLTIDASAVTSSVPGMLDLLGRTQRRLARHHGLLTVRGLRPHLLPDVGPGAGPPPRPGTAGRPVSRRVAS